MNLKEKALTEHQKKVTEKNFKLQREHHFTTTETESKFITTFQTHPDSVDGYRVEADGLIIYRKDDGWVLMGTCSICTLSVESKVFYTLGDLGEMLIKFSPSLSHAKVCARSEYVRLKAESRSRI
jgi:hypothetical protein